MKLIYTTRVNKKDEVHSVDASTLIERIRKTRISKRRPPPMSKDRYLIGRPPYNTKRIFFTDIV